MDVVKVSHMRRGLARLVEEVEHSFLEDEMPEPPVNLVLHLKAQLGNFAWVLACTEDSPEDSRLDSYLMDIAVTAIRAYIDRQIDSEVRRNEGEFSYGD